MTLRGSIAAAQRGGARPNEDGTTALEFQFHPDDPTFAGHFPGRPILPGVFQLELVRVTAEAVLHCPLTVREFRKAKFQRPILPGETVVVNLKLLETDGTITAQARLTSAGQPAGEVLLFLCRSH